MTGDRSYLLRETVLKQLQTVEHPEIALSLIDLGMIIDVAVEPGKVRIALALPMMNIPPTVLQAIEDALSKGLANLNLSVQTEYFEMLPEVKNAFFTRAKQNWKGAV